MTGFVWVFGCEASAALIGGEPLWPLTGFLGSCRAWRAADGCGMGFGGETGDSSVSEGVFWVDRNGTAEPGRFFGGDSGRSGCREVLPFASLLPEAGQDGVERGMSNEDRDLPASAEGPEASSRAVLVGCVCGREAFSNCARRDETGF